MNLKSGLPFWLIKNGLLFNYPKLEEDITTDVIIMGGGITGAIMANYIIEAGVQCVVVDARSIGQGSTCASTALLQYEIDFPLFELEKKVGHNNAVRSYKLCAASIIKLQTLAKKIGFTGFEMKKSLYYANNKKNASLIKNEFAKRKENGFAVHLLEEEEIKNDYGLKAPLAILSELAAQTDAYGFAHALHQYNIEKGVKVFDRSSIEKIKHEKNGVVLKSASGFTLKAKKLIYASGYETVNYIRKKIVSLQSTYAIISDNTSFQKEYWKDNSLIWNTENPYHYLRTANDGRIIIGGRDEEFYNPEKRDRLLPTKAKQLEKDFKKLFPKIEFHTDYFWCGTFASTKDGLPFIGAYKPLPNSYFALGYGGNGITFSLIAAEIICDLIKGKNNSDAAIFSFDRV